MSPWALRGLRDGVVTTRWPARPDSYENGWRGPATVRNPQPGSTEHLRALCPTGAITTGADGSVRLDQGRCILCGRCVNERPDTFGWSEGTAPAAALTRDGLVLPVSPQTPGGLAAVRTALHQRTAALRRSLHLRHVDAGSDGAEEQEIAALTNPVYDIHRLGIFFTASPRHADVLLVTGAGTHGMAEPLRRTYEAMPDPKIVVAVGTDAVSGGLMNGYATAGGAGSLLPVDVWVPGSPPPPFAILRALLVATGRLPEGRDR